MRLAILPCAIALLASTVAYADDDIGETCDGPGTLQVGNQAPRDLPYTLTFSADLTTGSYCYDKCGPDQTHAIADSTSPLIKLADFHSAKIVRLTTFDRRTSVLTDYYTLDLGRIGKTVRRASVTCRPAPFQAPAPLPSHKAH
ncbi:hypothetical protein WSK_2416 [Novosphingobium sp. Rr 2-17]|uniref:hypothetical protein n=1 Tax=Novosphingobium sp. Rr 2-17 TaxID=555793 RepID=UPI000269A81C|nr:hypothetical protein [Novosphingobium sp. Rr 2-17]EIZ78873.1 hypothetical protein WSK_2416 [Novosphingobium sp. Rr 2-17]